MHSTKNVNETTSRRRQTYMPALFTSTESEYLTLCKKRTQKTALGPTKVRKEALRRARRAAPRTVIQPLRMQPGFVLKQEEQSQCAVSCFVDVESLRPKSNGRTSSQSLVKPIPALWKLAYSNNIAISLQRKEMREYSIIN